MIHNFFLSIHTTLKALYTSHFIRRFHLKEFFIIPSFIDFTLILPLFSSNLNLIYDSPFLNRLIPFIYLKKNKFEKK